MWGWETEAPSLCVREKLTSRKWLCELKAVSAPGVSFWRIPPRTHSGQYR